MNAERFIAVILLVFLAVVTSWFLGISVTSFALTSLILVLTSILLIRIMFNGSRNLASWFKSESSDVDSRRGLIENMTATVKWAAKGGYHARIEIAHILRAALTKRFGGQLHSVHWKSASREDVRDELIMLVGSNPRVLEILYPKEDERRLHRFDKRPSHDDDEYMSSLEEAIKIVSEREK